MVQRYTVLIIDDHPLISGAYKSALIHVALINKLLEFKIDMANNCELAFQKINEASKKNGIDIIFLDIRLPPYNACKILSGEDLGIKIRELLPNSKIIISTSFNDNYRIHNLFKSVNPDGFLIKDDITPEELKTAIQNVIKGMPYYSTTVVKLLRKQVSSNFLLDKIDRQLLYELSIGTKMKELPNILPLSIAGIEKRKRQLKNIFEVTSIDDRDLLLKAREKGFI